MVEPVTVMVKWDHEDEETRLLIAIRELTDMLALTNQELARVFDYLARRHREEDGLRGR